MYQIVVSSGAVGSMNQIVVKTDAGGSTIKKMYKLKQQPEQKVVFANAVCSMDQKDSYTDAVGSFGSMYQTYV